MITENLSTLKIHKLTQAQYDRELEAGRIDENALYLTPDDAHYATKEYVDNAVSTIDADDSLLVTVDVSTMTANYSKTEIINASKSGKVVYADVSNQLFILKNALNASFAEMSYLTGGTKIDLTSFYIDDEKKVHLNVSDTFNLLPNYSASDYGKYVTPSDKGLIYKDLPKTESIQADWQQTDETAMDFIRNKPNEIDALELVMEMSLVEPITANDGAIYTDENGALYIL